MEWQLIDLSKQFSTPAPIQNMGARKCVYTLSSCSMPDSQSATLNFTRWGACSDFLWNFMCAQGGNVNIPGESYSCSLSSQVRINNPRGINQPPLPKKKCNLKKGGPPGLINRLAGTWLINPSAEIHFLSNNFYFQFYLFPIVFTFFLSSLLYLRFKLIIENFKKQLFPKWSISN